MQFEYDPIKSQSNKAKHGIDFEEAQALWDDGESLIIAVDRPGESRHVVIGFMMGIHWTAVVTFRGEAIRLISCRRARKEEVRLYEQQ
jgi:Uncharacterized protein conserved in bacteria